MTNKKRSHNNYIPEKDELEEESNQRINVKENNHLKTGRVDFPEVEEEYT